MPESLFSPKDLTNQRSWKPSLGQRESPASGYLRTAIALRVTGLISCEDERQIARPLPERRQKRSPLRDVASMLRSFAYVTSAVEIQRGEEAPLGFEQRARDRFLEHYLDEVDATLLPAGQAQVANLLSIFELEKAIYELRYELDHRPDWISIPVAGIRRLLEAE